MDLPIVQPIKRPINTTPISPLTPTDTTVNLSFNVPFSSNLSGPDVDEIIHASPKALERWTFPEGTEEGMPTHKLPVHHYNVEQLRRSCRVLTEGSQGRVEATVTSSEPKSIPALQRRPLKGLVTNVCISGENETVHKMRAKILNDTPIALVKIHHELYRGPQMLISWQRCAIVDIDTNLVVTQDMINIRVEVLKHLDEVSKWTGTDIFLLNPKHSDSESPAASYGNGSHQRFDQRLRIAIYGDPESSEHAKTRVLIMIDKVVSSIAASNGGTC